MRTLEIIASLVAALALAAGQAAGAVPEKKALGIYGNLWTDSLFTNPPIPIPEDDPVDPLENYALAGLGKLQDGWYVLLMNKKDRKERITLKPHTVNAKGFEVVNVELGQSHRESRVEVKVGTRTSWVEFDRKLLGISVPVVLSRAGQALGDATPAPGRRVRIRRVPTTEEEKDK